MSDEKKTHYRKAFNSPYLSSGDIVEPTILTIERAELLPDKTKRTKDNFNTIFFVEKEIRPGEDLKPMILNATNSRTMKDLTGSPFLNDWNGTNITVYVDTNVKMMGDTVEGLRISKEAPRMQKPELIKGSEEWGRAVDSYIENKNLDLIKKHRSISQEAEKALKEEAENVA